MIRPNERWNDSPPRADAVCRIVRGTEPAVLIANPSFFVCGIVSFFEPTVIGVFCRRAVSCPSGDLSCSSVTKSAVHFSVCRRRRWIVWPVGFIPRPERNISIFSISSPFDSIETRSIRFRNGSSRVLVIQSKAYDLLTDSAADKRRRRRHDGERLQPMRRRKPQKPEEIEILAIHRLLADFVGRVERFVAGADDGVRSRPGRQPSTVAAQIDAARLQAARAQRVGEHAGRQRTHRRQNHERRSAIPTARAKLQHGHCFQRRGRHWRRPSYDTGTSTIFFFFRRQLIISFLAIGLRRTLSFETARGKLTRH